MVHPYQSLATSEDDVKAPHSVVDLAPPPPPPPTFASRWGQSSTPIWIFVVPLVIVIGGAPFLYYLYRQVAPGGVEVAQIPRAAWSAEEQELRKYRWGYHAPDATLLQALDSLSPEERAVREWLLKSRVISGSGVGIGLGRQDRKVSAAMRRAPLAIREEGATSLRSLNLTGGSTRKHEDLEEERDTGRQATMCKVENSLWEPDYTALHAEMMDGTREAWLLETACSARTTDCGGISDRLLGITSAAMWSILTGRSISISWQNVPADLLFDSANIDWSQPFRSANPPTHPIFDSKELNSSTVDFFIHNQHLHNKKLEGIWERALSDWQDRGPNASRWVKMDRANRGIMLRMRESAIARPAIDALGLTEQSSYSCMMDYLFRPKADTLRLISEYSSFLSLPSIFSIGIQIRLGDMEMVNPNHNTSIDNHRHFFDCADQIAAARALPGQRVVYYLVSDSQSLKKSALEAFPGKILVSGLKPHHAEIDEYLHPSIPFALDGQHGAVAEMWTLRDVDFHIISLKSSFGKIPTWMHGGDGAIALQREWSENKPKIQCTPASISTLMGLAMSYASG